METLTKIENSSRVGDFVHDGQTMGKAEGFANVSKKWLDKTMTYDAAFEAIEQEKRGRNDIAIDLADVDFGTDGNNMVVRAEGQAYACTPHALSQVAVKLGVGSWYAEKLASAKYANDGAMLASVLQHGRNCTVQDIGSSKRRTNMMFLRTYSDGTLRAFLTEKYQTIDNGWYLDILRKTIPGGRVSHWNGDADSIYGNILITDTIREEKDSDYGGMLSISNCEIGKRRLGSTPSTFRAICMNGCIWGQKMGQAIRQVHRGEIDLINLETQIVKNLTSQIPLLPQGIDRLLFTRTLHTNVSARPLVAAVASDYKLTPSQAKLVLENYYVEEQAVSEYRGTLFALTNAFTRAAQKLDAANWVKFDEIGGELIGLADKGQDTGKVASRWQQFNAVAVGMSAESVDELLGVG